MSDHDGNKGKGRKKIRRKARSSYEKASYEVGKGKPPKQSQFKPGGKGGPGRPRGSRNKSDIDKVLDRKIVVGEDSLGRPVRKTVRDVINTQLANKAVKGDNAAIKLIKELEFKAQLANSRAQDTPTSDEILAAAREEEKRSKNADRITKTISSYLNHIAELKKLGLIDFDGEGDFDWTSKGIQLLEIAGRSEFTSPDYDLPSSS
ncbi:MAG: DUF5681 domain-containing protein [Cyanobacteria bacterium J06555_12]